MSWCAGLYEGEGSICLQSSHTTRGIRMTLGSTDLDVLQSFQQIMGGNVNGPYKGQGKKTPEHYKPMYHWGTGKFGLIKEILEKFDPYLSTRRKEQASKVLAEYHSMLRMPQRARKSY